MAGERAWRGVCMVGEKCVAGETAIAVGGMHPTGMHSCQIVISTWDNKYEIFINLLLLSATVVAERLCFQGCLSTGRCTSPLGRHPPARQTPPSRHPPGQTPPQPKMATAADGTHPTGMHSCSKYGFCLVYIEISSE